MESVGRVEAEVNLQTVQIGSLVASLEASFQLPERGRLEADRVLDFRESDSRKMSSFCRFLMDWRGLYPVEFGALVTAPRRCLTGSMDCGSGPSIRSSVLSFFQPSSVPETGVRYRNFPTPGRLHLSIGFREVIMNRPSAGWLATVSDGKIDRT